MRPDGIDDDAGRVHFPAVAPRRPVEAHDAAHFARGGPLARLLGEHRVDQGFERVAGRPGTGRDLPSHARAWR
jgi:hypothetical protein